MRRARFTWPGAYHHVMNRGIEGMAIFETDHLKDRFISMLAESTERTKLRVFAYCIMDNHFHLVLENSSERLSDFCRLACGTFGSYFRFLRQDRGYVFQGRFKSTLIEDDCYLKQALAYVLFNPVKSSYCAQADQYQWSSIHHYFSQSPAPWLAVDLVEGLFGNREQLLQSLAEQDALFQINQVNTKRGFILGGPDFPNIAKQRSNRRRGSQSVMRRRSDDLHFEPAAKVIQEFERLHEVDIAHINTKTYAGKRLRAELLVKLVDLCGLRFHEISKMEPFSDVRFESLRTICRNVRKKTSGKSR